MRVRLLGTAAGGGLPQWNCNCRNCRAVRRGVAKIRPRTQSSVAISQDGKRWFLLNVSPDLARQIEAFPPLHPGGRSLRGTSIQGVLLTNADLDHTLGLLLLREGSSLSIYASRQTQSALTSGLRLLPVIRSFCTTKLFTASFTPSPLCYAEGSPSGLVYQAFRVPSKQSRFTKSSRPARHQDGAIGYKISDTISGGSLIYVPEIAEVTADLAATLNDCNLLLFDGTFWSDDEMLRLGINDKTALSMGHIPIHGANGSLQKLAKVNRPRKIFVHINNTNPILRRDSPEERQSRAAGWQVGEDGMEFKL